MRFCMGELTAATLEKGMDGQLHLVDPIEHAASLNSTAVEVPKDEITAPHTKHVIDEMRRIAAGKDSEGGAQMVGLAAPQVGVAQRIALVDIAATGMRERQQLTAMINPEIIEGGSEVVDGREGCWSCGSYCANVPRANQITVAYYDEDGQNQQRTLQGFTARIVQHEIDHLDGMRCIDRVPEDQPQRLHRVDLNNKDEFDSYRTEWPHWPKTFPRSEWQHYRMGEKLPVTITGEQMEGFVYYKAYKDGEQAGMVRLSERPTQEVELLDKFPTIPIVYQLYVNDGERGKGLGARLMDVVEDTARSRGDKKLLLCVVPDNTVARTMYERRGYTYVTDHTIESIWQNNGNTHVVQVLPMIKMLGRA